MADITGKKVQDAKKVDILMEAITFYTNQLEDYDKSNFTACISCIGFVGGIIAVIGAILSSESSVNDLLMSRVVPTLLLLIPAIVTLFMYNFSMNCRRSAIFSGYVQFLEEQLNKEIDQKIMLYSSFLISQKYATYKVNHYGPVAMFTVLLIIFVICLACSFYFMICKSALPCDLYVGACVVLGCICVALTGCYAYSLTQNNKAMEDAKAACVNQFSM